MQPPPVRGAYGRLNSPPGGWMWYHWLLVFLLVALGTVALIFGIAGFSNSRTHVHPSTFGEMAIQGPVPFAFDVNTTCIPLAGFTMQHEQGLSVMPDYIEIEEPGIYWYEIQAVVSFGDHFFFWTPWRSSLGVDGEKALTEGYARDVAWYSALNESHISGLINWPIFPNTPADMTLSGMISLNAGQRMTIIVGFPEFCKFCGLVEQGIHGPGNVTVESARIATHLLHATSPSGKVVASLLFLAALLLV